MMNSILLYFLKSGLAMALFYGIYRLFLEKETNYSLNRYYLVGTLLLSLTLPVLPLEKIFFVEKAINVPVFISLDGQGLTDAGIEIGSVSDPGFHLTGYALARIIYIAGIVILLATLIFQLFNLIFIRKVGKEKYGSMSIIYVVKKILPFSILNRVYLNQDVRRDPKIKTILDHEYAHYRSLHYIDLLLLEFITIFQWFNPFTWLYVRSLKEIHEYQADAAVLRNGEVTGSYQALLVNQLTGTEVFRLANGFSKSLTKKRMIMMTKMKSKKGAWLKILLAMPVLAILLIAFAANSKTMPDEDPVIFKGKVVEAESGSPLPGVSVIWKGHTTGTITDMNGNFILELPDKDAVLVYSFVGFETATTNGVGSHTVKMERKTFQITEAPTLNKTEAIETAGDEYIVEGKVIEASSGKSLSGVNVIWKNTTTGTITDNNGDFILKVLQKDAAVVYAILGYENASTEGAGKYTVEMKKKTDQKSGTGAMALIQSAEGGSGEPLYVVDGEPGARLPDPDDMESITVLKGESATEKYGSLGANGVIIVTTKKGTSKDEAVVKDPAGNEEVFYIVEDMPKFQGKNHNASLKYVQEHLEYPQEAIEKGLEGTVDIVFVVNHKSKVTKARLKKAGDPLLDKAALKAVNSMPDWTPGKQRGKPVAVQFEVPVEFKR